MTKPEENEMMLFKREPLRYEAGKISRTAIDFKNLLTIAAAKMMMMSFSGHFVAGRFARQRDRYEPAFREERINRPIDGGYSQMRYEALGVAEHFFGRKGAVVRSKRLRDCRALLGTAFGCNTFRKHEIKNTLR